MPNRFHRNELLLGGEAVQRLREARVTVCGLGGVGAAAVEALARAGIGNLRVIDSDCYGLSNLNRQLFATEKTIGRPKAEVAKERILEINPACEVEAIRMQINEQTTDSVFEPLPDVLIDAIDMLSPKTGLLQRAVELNVPCIISSMGAANRLDPVQVRIADLSKTRHCRLARFIRKRLRKRDIRHGIRCVYSEEPHRRPATEPETPEFEESSKTIDGQERPPLGSISYMPPIFGFTAAAEAIRFIAGQTDE